jgi:hypothetical protein
LRLRFWSFIAFVFGTVAEYAVDQRDAILYPPPVYVAPPPPPERIIIPSDVPLPKTPIVVEGEPITSYQGWEADPDALYWEEKLRRARGQ